MANRGVERLLEEVQLSSASLFPEKLMSALSSDDLEGLDDEDVDGSEDLDDDISSIAISDLSFTPRASSHMAAEQRWFFAQKHGHTSHTLRLADTVVRLMAAPQEKPAAGAQRQRD
mmetsp:Transcript_3293/g.5309  ORF Transcript_3293/g.5309 Transcript_3293/m.5309 type:complete len:116 (+) Transcript_3293:219-566(+)